MFVERVNLEQKGMLIGHIGICWNKWTAVKKKTQNCQFYSLQIKSLWSYSEMETGRVDRPVGLPVGSRFFDRPVKPVEKPVKFSFFGTKKAFSTNQNILIYFIINKTFYKKSVWTSHIFRKLLLNGFKLWPLRHAQCTSRDVFRVGVLCQATPLWAMAQSKKFKIYVKIA